MATSVAPVIAAPSQQAGRGIAELDERFARRDLDRTKDVVGAQHRVGAPFTVAYQPVAY